MDSRIYDYLDQCFHDCENYPREDKPEPDIDFMRGLKREENTNGCNV